MTDLEVECGRGKLVLSLGGALQGLRPAALAAAGTGGALTPDHVVTRHNAIRMRVATVVIFEYYAIVRDPRRPKVVLHADRADVESI